MQATSNASLFQTSYSEALGAYRSRKAILTSGLLPSSSGTSPSSSASSSSSAAARWGYPIHLNPHFADVINNTPEDLAVEGSGADGGRFRVLSLRVTTDNFIWTSEAGGVVRQIEAETGRTANVYKGAKGPVPSFDFIELLSEGANENRQKQSLLVTDRGIKRFASTRFPVWRMTRQQQQQRCRSKSSKVQWETLSSAFTFLLRKAKRTSRQVEAISRS